MEQIKEDEFWTWTDTEIFERLGTSDLGLNTEAAQTRLQELGPNSISSEERVSVIWLLWRQVRSPLIWILVFAAIASLATKEWTEAGLVIGIILISAAMGFIQEFRASKAIQLGCSGPRDWDRFGRPRPETNPTPLGQQGRAPVYDRPWRN